MEIQKIKELIELLQDTDITEFELSEGDSSVKFSKHKPVTTVVQASDIVSAPISQLGQSSVQPVQTQSVPASDETGGVEAVQPQETAPSKTINSPMVGTFYAASSPDAEPFVKVGQSVSVGEPVCIVEAMKMFNKVDAEVSGVVTKILVTDGEPVEFDQPLFEVE